MLNMLIQTLHENTLLHVLDATKLNLVLLGLTPDFVNCSKDENILDLEFKSTSIRLPLTSSITWGQLLKSLKEKGLINELNR